MASDKNINELNYKSEVNSILTKRLGSPNATNMMHHNNIINTNVNVYEREHVTNLRNSNTDFTETQNIPDPNCTSSS